MRMIDADVASKRFRGWLEGPHESTVYNSGFDDAIWRVLDVIDHMPTITPSNEWVSVEERLPEFPGFLDHIMVITCDKNNHVIPMVRERTLVGYEWVERWLYPWNKIYDGPEIIYWTSLPKPPKGGLKNADD